MKIITLFLATLALTAVASAQEITATAPESTASSPDRAVRRIMPQFQVIQTDYQGSDNGLVKNGQIGWQSGLLFDIGTSQHLVFETGALYREVNSQGVNGFGTTGFVDDTIAVPATLKVYFIGQESTSPYIKVGGMGTALAQRIVNYPPGYSGPPYDFNNRTFDIYAEGGLGMKFVLTKSADVFIEANYTRNFQSVFNNATVYVATWNYGAGFGVNL